VYLDLEVEIQSENRDIESLPHSYFENPPISLVVGVNSKALKAAVHVVVFSSLPHDEAIHHLTAAGPLVRLLTSMAAVDGYMDHIREAGARPITTVDFHLLELGPLINGVPPKASIGSLG
jgi:hypothetical protein